MAGGYLIDDGKDEFIFEGGGIDKEDIKLKEREREDKEDDSKSKDIGYILDKEIKRAERALQRKMDLINDYKKRMDDIRLYELPQLRVDITRKIKAKEMLTAQLPDAEKMRERKEKQKEYREKIQREYKERVQNQNLQNQDTQTTQEIQDNENENDPANQS